MTEEKQGENKETTEKVITKKLSKEEQQLQKLLQYANLTRLIKKDVQTTQLTFQKAISRDEISKWLITPQKFGKNLRNASRFLYDISPHYKRLTQYFATMLNFDYYIEPYGMKDFNLTEKQLKDFKKKYINAINFLETMNLKHEFLKVCEKAWVDDAVYYYELRLSDSYFLFPLDPDFCIITGIEDGCFTFSFDFSYFDRRKDELNNYPVEFQEKYNIYTANKTVHKVQKIDPDKSLCIKIVESVDYVIPPFCGLFEDVYAVGDYKSLSLAKAEMDNYLLIVPKIPLRKDATPENAFAIDLKVAREFFDLAMQQLPDYVGGFLSIFENVESIKTEKNEKSRDYVAESSKALYDSAGVSQHLFNSDSVGAAISKSIMLDENIAFKVLRQLERWVNKKLKDENKGFKFRAQFLDSTRFNEDDVSKRLKEAATLGLPVKMKYGASLGLSPSATLHMEFLENDVLSITDKWKPLQSTHTQNGENEGGRPAIDDDGDLSDAGGVTRDTDGNDPDNRDY